MAEILSQEEIEALLDVCEEEDNKNTVLFDLKNLPVDGIYGDIYFKIDNILMTRLMHALEENPKEKEYLFNKNLQNIGEVIEENFLGLTGYEVKASNYENEGDSNYYIIFFTSPISKIIYVEISKKLQENLHFSMVAEDLNKNTATSEMDDIINEESREFIKSTFQLLLYNEQFNNYVFDVIDIQKADINNMDSYSFSIDHLNEHLGFIKIYS